MITGRSPRTRLSLTQVKMKFKIVFKKKIVFVFNSL